MDAAFDPRTFSATRADLAARMGSNISGLALLDSDSRVSALDEGFAETVGEDAVDVVGRTLPWVFHKLGLSKKTDPSDLMNRPMELPNGQQAAMGLTADGLALTLIGEVTVEPAAVIEERAPEPVAEPIREESKAPSLDDFVVSLGACRDAEDLAVVLENWLPELLPSSTGTYAELLDQRAVVSSSWPAGTMPKPTQFSADKCMALRLGRTYPDATTRVPLPCRHGVDGVCVPVTWTGRVLGVLSATNASAENLEKIARVLAPYASRLAE